MESLEQEAPIERRITIVDLAWLQGPTMNASSQSILAPSTHWAWRNLYADLEVDSSEFHGSISAIFQDNFNVTYYAALGMARFV